MALGTIGALVASTIGSSLIGGAASMAGANANASASREANALQKYQFDKTIELTDPQRKMGQNALSAMAYEMGVGGVPQFVNPMSGAGGGLEISSSYVPGANGGAVQYDDFGNPMAGGGAVEQFRVGDMSFDTRDAAQAYIDSQQSEGMPEWGGFKTSPGYNYRMDEGQRGLERSRAARGMGLGGASMKEAMRHNQGMASSEYGNWWNRLAGIAQGGQQATNTQVNAGANYANQAGQNFLNQGNAQASGYAGINNALQSGINNGFSLWGMQQSGLFNNMGGGNLNYGGIT